MARGATDRNEAFRRLYRVHVRSVYAFFAYSVGRETAEDLTAVTFERALRALDRYDETKAGERTWLLAIARNALTDHFRRESHRSTVSTDEHPVLLDQLVDDADVIASRASVETLVAWLAALKPRQREVLALRFGADLSTPEIADHLGISEQNVHQLSSRALRALREHLEGLSDSAGSRD